MRGSQGRWAATAKWRKISMSSTHKMRNFVTSFAWSYDQCSIRTFFHHHNAPEYKEISIYSAVSATVATFTIFWQIFDIFLKRFRGLRVKRKPLQKLSKRCQKFAENLNQKLQAFTNVTCLAQCKIRGNNLPFAGHPFQSRAWNLTWPWQALTY